MSSETAGSITNLVGRLAAGDRVAADQLVRRFLPRLVGLAHHTLAGRTQRFTGAEDAVQSALLSFWRGVERGDFDRPADRDNLWNLLGLITVCKVRKHVRRELAQKRGGGRVIGEGDLASRTPPGDVEFRLDELLGDVATQEFDQHCEELLTQLDDELRPFALLRLLGYSTAEIATELQCTQRKVQRKIALVGLHWREELLE